MPQGPPPGPAQPNYTAPATPTPIGFPPPTGHEIPARPSGEGWPPTGGGQFQTPSTFGAPGQPWPPESADSPGAVHAAFSGERGEETPPRRGPGSEPSVPTSDAPAVSTMPATRIPTQSSGSSMPPSVSAEDSSPDALSPAGSEQASFSSSTASEAGPTPEVAGASTPEPGADADLGEQGGQAGDPVLNVAASLMRPEPDSTPEVSASPAQPESGPAVPPHPAERYQGRAQVPTRPSASHTPPAVQPAERPDQDHRADPVRGTVYGGGTLPAPPARSHPYGNTGGYGVLSPLETTNGSLTGQIFGPRSPFSLPPPEPEPERRSNRRVLIILGIVFTVMVGLGVVAALYMEDLITWMFSG
ncbi:hypothetical protein [Longispora fulva]|uniref:Uncharacterized protein n=1 Tax=Longispora fulva TaxID=619741 RepID=A0A8J7GWD2_9ACTN|nr:hypothetical protein [Longispora fulva]MBG6139979.1 hypothetical protein [Longispora fulva]